MRCLAVVVVLALALSAAVLPCRASPLEDDLKRCVSRDIAACGRAIDSGELSPHNLAVAFASRALAQVDARRFDLAIADYDAAIRIVPDEAELYYDRGTAWHRQGDNARAIADYDEAIRLRPDHALAFNNRANAYLDMELPERAIEDYSEAIRLNPDYALAFLNRGIAFRKLGKRDLSDADFRKAHALDPAL